MRNLAILVLRIVLGSGRSVGPTDGTKQKPQHAKNWLLVVAVVAAVAWTGWISLLPEAPTNSPTLADVGNDEQVSLYACIFAENSVRRHIEPQKVGFDSCGAKDKFKIGLSATEISVSGTANVAGGKILPFTVTMQRSQPGTGKYGFVLLGIEI